MEIMELVFCAFNSSSSKNRFSLKFFFQKKNLRTPERSDKGTNTQMNKLKQANRQNRTIYQMNKVQMKK